MSFTDAQKALLSAKLDPANVKERSQAGRTFSYIEAWQAKAECNTVFGFDGWDCMTTELRMVTERERKLGKAPNEYDGWTVSYVATVRVVVRAGDTVVYRDGTGAGHGVDRDLGQAHESAIKEAESDAMKRALTSFGWRFGLALYDKDKEHVGRESTEGEADRLIAQFDALTKLDAVLLWPEQNKAALDALDTGSYNRVLAVWKSKKRTLAPRTNGNGHHGHGDPASQ